MHKARLEAFSDGVIAILITIMVLELKAPSGVDWHALHGSLPTLLGYVLSYVFLGIYWNNHHHMLHAAHKVNGAILWANLHLLFWLSLIPFITAWMTKDGAAPVPVAVYGIVLLLCGVAFTILKEAILRNEGPDSKLAQAVGRDVKGWASLVLYAAAIPMAFLWTRGAIAIYVIVACMWLVPDRRIERRVE